MSEEKKILVKFRWDCGRQGKLEGLFVCTEEDRQKLIGKHVYFGEVLGKHSEIAGTIEESELTVLSEDQEKINWLTSVTGCNVSGRNPFDYLNDEEED